MKRFKEFIPQALFIMAFLLGQMPAFAQPCAVMSDAMHHAEKKMSQAAPHDLHGIDSHDDMPCHDTEEQNKDTSKKDCCGTVLCKCSAACQLKVLPYQESYTHPVPADKFQHATTRMLVFLIAERLERPPRLS